MEKEKKEKSGNFIVQIIEKDLKDGKHKGRVHTRFPPEPNGYLHIGHAKSICLNFGLAEKYNGLCNLRFDDTNPETEEVEYVESIKEDIKWLGYDWEDRCYFASDYFDQLYEWAVKLIKEGKAYVCDMTMEEISESRGTPKIPGKESPYRNRSVKENLELFEKMKNGDYNDGEKVLRAKIDMASPNMHMRDPAMYRIKKVAHHRTGKNWCIYPMYDFTHGQSDFIEKITHSICTLEFEVHRPLYDWYLDQIIENGDYRPRQYEFARLNLSYTIMSKRKLMKLVKENFVEGWDDPRMPTISGLRRRGYTPKSIRMFSDMVGVTKRENIIDLALLEYCVREDLNKVAERRLAVIDPIKVIIENYPEKKIEYLEAVNNPEAEKMEHRKIPFSREIFIEASDFMENPPKKYFRLFPGNDVRLRYGYILHCIGAEKNEDGSINYIKCTYYPETKGGKAPEGKKIKGTIHWVAASESIDAEFRLYDRLFKVENPDKLFDGQNDFTDNLNEESLKVVNGKVEVNLKDTKAEEKFQFERIGYFCTDRSSTREKLVFNKTVGLRDSWSKKNV